jgi:AraC-like DNA-binding protein
MMRKLSWGVASYIGMAIVFSIFLSYSAAEILPKFDFVFLALASTVFIATGYYLYYSFPPFHKAYEIVQAPVSVSVDFPSGTEKYQSSSLDQKDLSSILGTIERYMLEQEAYKRPNLKIGELAEAIDIPSHHISQCLNQKLGENFFEFVNSYRIEAVKKQLQEGRHQQLTLWAIAKECGFNSQSSFYRIFKDYTGLTPSSYIKKLT